MRKDQKDFLHALLDAHGTSGFEGEVRKVWADRVSKHADEVATDVMGNCIATLNPEGRPRILLAGHIDEIGFQVTHISEKGFLSFTTVGGHDVSLIPGRRVKIHTAKGVVPGVTGKKAIHMMTPEERKKVKPIEELWIDIGATDQEEAASSVAVGDAVTHDAGYQELANGKVTARALDDRTGAFVAAETLLSVARNKTKPRACIVAVATVQEEIGVRGAITSTYGVDPDVGICIDVTHATDSPGIDQRKYGDIKLGGGPSLARGSSVSPKVFEFLSKSAKRAKVPYQVGAQPGIAPNDTRAIQVSREGVASGTVGLPLRYMHTPSEVIDLSDLDASIKLLSEFCKGLSPRTNLFPD